MGFIVSILTFVTTVICVRVLTRYWCWRNTNENARLYQDIPGPPGAPLLANIFEMKEGLSTLLDTYMKFTRTYGGLVKVKSLRFDLLIISDYKWVNFILDKVFKNSENCEFLRSWIKFGPLASEESASSGNIDEHFLEVFESNGNKLIQELEPQVGNNSVDIYPYITSCVQDIICESFMGVSIKAQDYGHGLREICKTVFEACVFAAQVNYLYLFSKHYRSQRKFFRVLREKFDTVINQRRKELAEAKQKSETTGDDGINTTKKKNLLDSLLEKEILGAPFTLEEIKEEVITLIFEGLDTTASALSFTLYCLATNPEVQQKAFEEQKSIFANLETRTATITDLQNMKYLELVIKESLRLYPSVPYFGGINPENIVHENTLLPQDNTLLLFIYAMHRNPEYFKEPEKFDPARFESMDKFKPNVYMPFGTKKCLGQKFTMLEIKSVTSKILRNFEILPALPHHSLKLIVETVLMSSNGIKMKLKKRFNNPLLN